MTVSTWKWSSIKRLNLPSKHSCFCKLYIVQCIYMYVCLTVIGIIGETENDNQSKAETKSSMTDEVVATGDVGTNLLKSIPLTLSVNLECVEGVAVLDRRAK